ncbi:D-ribose pyranase [Miniphocaeibacter halophilus]|uniref:D-ribose pyranase n=1 Tax=Miniphocaeibacter halophilus TaxID=2931922 RepID=A0AC61MR68_9FIRM|nr:D-ribose pyranase [Miniphocaeibacter halophilus]QQK07080.1 D-ribose pyranase [Miniphocaeibacter halophilus]
MKKNGILNSEISKVLSDLGHTDMITISDCGLPIPDGVEKIDISLKFGVPSFIETLKEILKDMKVEKIILAKEIINDNEIILKEIKKLIDKNIEIEFIEHEKFKKVTNKSKAIIRTGENTPFANIILVSGCIF